MPIRRGFFGGFVSQAPDATANAVTNFNQDRATFNATVSWNLYPTTVYFDYSTSSTFASYSTATYGSTVSAQSSSVYVNVTGLSVGTTYYVRVRAVNQAGTTISGSVSFTTWSLKTYLNTTAGSFSLSVPSITPTGGSAIAPVIYEMLIYGGGGGANYAGGGGGGYRIFASHTSSVAGTQNITGTVGAGGGGGNGGAGTGGAGTGGTSSITVGGSTWSATGGGPGNHPGNPCSPSGTGGASGSGDNTSKGGGSNTYGYYYQCNPYNCNPYACNPYQCNPYCCGGVDKNGNCLGWCYETCYQTCYQTCYNTCCDANVYAGGGGGGTDSAGSNASGTTSQVGGNGGNGGGAYGLRGGNGGGGRGTQGIGSNGSTSGSGPIVGTGGQGWFNAGVAGGVTFKYYGP
jgi:hypothetical protein